MATAQSYTLAKMQELFGDNIIDGEVDSSGHLIFTTRDGETIDSGDVSVWLPGRLKAVNNLGAGYDPDTLIDNGWYAGYDWINSLAGYGIGILEVQRFSADWILQTFSQPTPIVRQWVRSRHSGTTWSAWRELNVAATTAVRGEVVLATEAEVTAGTDNTKATTPLSLRNLTIGQVIPAGVNLNTYVATGQYHSQSNANATLALNYPLAGNSGQLVVESSPAYIAQTFICRVPNRIFVRGKYSSNAWSAWTELTDPWIGTGPPAFNAKLTSDFTKSGASSWVKVPFTTELLDSLGNYDAVNSAFTAPVAGRYEFTGSLTANAATGGPLYKFCRNNETMTGGPFDGVGYGVAYNSAGFSRIYNLAAGDIIELWLNNGNGATITLPAGYSNYFSGKLLR